MRDCSNQAHCAGQNAGHILSGHCQKQVQPLGYSLGKLQGYIKLKYVVVKTSGSKL